MSSRPCPIEWDSFFVDAGPPSCYSPVLQTIITRTPVAVPRIRLWLAAAALAISGCGGPFPQSTLHPRSDFARATDVLFTDIFWWAAAVFSAVELLLLVEFVWLRHRRGWRSQMPSH